MNFNFVLGYSEELAKLELESVFGQTPTKIEAGRYLVELENLAQVKRLADRLGGLVEVRSQPENRLVWRHNSRDWFRRDRLKPFVDRRKGLLPPKIARILVNLAVGRDEISSKTLLDPFCGSGTILMEAGTLGLSLVGNDLDLVQLAGAKNNLDWAGVQAELFNSDAVKISHQVKKNIDYIVTEPYMGKVTARVDRLPDLAKGLKKLYLGCLKDWYKILSPGGRVAMIFPVFEYKSQIYSTSDIIDDKHLLGYNIKTRGLMYFRPLARVKREIVVLEKT